MATSTARRRSGRKQAETHLTEIPDHLVAEIFLRLPAAEDLARASASCVSFHRIVADKSFLRRFRRLHDPPLLGFFDCDGFQPALPPHPSAPVARAVAAAADFSFSFIPNHLHWVVSDIRDGRFLLVRPGEGKKPQVCPELAVCDPLHRRYALLPPLPDEEAGAASVPLQAMESEPWCEAFLVPLDEEAEAAFSVVWIVHFATKLAAFVYSSTTGQWQAVASKEWIELFLDRGESTTMVPPIHRDFYGRHYAYGCFYWEYTMAEKKELLVFDTRRMEFSISDLPQREWCTGLAIVEAGEGRLGLFGILDGTFFGKFDLFFYTRENNSSQWQLEKTISLVGFPCKHDIKAATGRYVLLERFNVMGFLDSTQQMPDCEYFSVDVKTLRLERVCSTSSRFASKTWIYTNFPPSLSSPSI